MIFNLLLPKFTVTAVYLCHYDISITAEFKYLEINLAVCPGHKTQYYGGHSSINCDWMHTVIIILALRHNKRVSIRENFQLCNVK